MKILIRLKGNSMGGTFFNSTVLTFKPSWSKVKNGVKVDSGTTSGGLEWVPQTNTVSSYRTRGEIGQRSSEASDEDTLINSGSHVNQARNLVHDYLRDKASSQGNTGHPFQVTKQMYSAPAISSNFVRGGNRYSYTGDLYQGPTAAPSLFPTLPSTNAVYYGTRAIASTLPTNPYAKTLQAVVEAKREGIPDLPGIHALRNRAHGPLTAGHEYLNLEFGWKPLVRDVQDAAKAVLKQHKILSNFHNNAGRLVKRTWSLPEITTTQVNNGIGYISMPLGTLAGDGNWYYLWDDNGFPPTRNDIPYSETITTSQLYWFSSSYTYAAPQGGSILGELDRIQSDAHKLLGVRITPSLLWELSPWSWLVDWKWNVGPVLQNLSALHSDGLVMKYGFLMCTTTSIRTRTFRTTIPRTSTPASYTFTWQSVRKERVASSPYGFASNPASFTTKQWSILGALGLTKSEKALF